MLWFIKAYDYNQKRVLNVSFCTRYMGPPFFSRAIPTYGVLPYSMIVELHVRTGLRVTHSNPLLQLNSTLLHLAKVYCHSQTTQPLHICVCMQGGATGYNMDI